MSTLKHFSEKQANYLRYQHRRNIQYLENTWKNALQKAEEDSLKAEQDIQKAEEIRMKAEEQARQAEEVRLRAEEQARQSEEGRLKAEEDKQKGLARERQLEALLRSLGVEPPPEEPNELSD